MIKNLERMARSGDAKHRPKGWTPERRARQAGLIRGWQPWRRSTGPKTEAGKARSSMNGLKHGYWSRARIEEYRRVRNAIRMAVLNNAILRAFNRARDLPRRSDNVAKAGGRPDLKPVYEMRLSMAQDRLRQFLAKVHPDIFQKSDDRTIENGNSPTRPIAYDRATQRPHGFGRSRATSHSSRERGTVLLSPKRVGRRLVAPKPRSGEGGKEPSMSSDTLTRMKDKFVTVDGLNTRYIEEGPGEPGAPAVLLLHGASLGSSADVFIRNLGPLARAGFRAIAFDQPGFGLTDTPADHSPAYRRDFVPKFMDALGLSRAALVGHSQAGNPAVQLALKEPAHYSHVIVLGTGSLLPPLDGAGDVEGAAQQRLERRMAHQEPSIEDTRKLLEANLFHHDLITEDELALRHSRSVGQAFDAFVARNREADSAPAKEPKTPMWQRLTEVQVPLLLIFGREDRARAADRANLLKQKSPQLDIHIIPNCKHLVPWDAADQWIALAVPVLKK